MSYPKKHGHDPQITRRREQGDPRGERKQMSERKQTRERERGRERGSKEDKEKAKKIKRKQRCLEKYHLRSGEILRNIFKMKTSFPVDENLNSFGTQHLK